MTGMPLLNDEVKMTEAAEAKTKNIIDMALMFTGMIRAFSKGSKPIIIKRLEKDFAYLLRVKTREDYEVIHTSFCNWFIKNIYTAKTGKNASYGQAAKVFDISIKVYVYYCVQPTLEVSQRIIPFLHGAVDTPIMNDLTSRFPGTGILSKTIWEVGQDEYRMLQSSVARDITATFASRVLPVQWDDIMWNRLNR